MIFRICMISILYEGALHLITRHNWSKILFHVNLPLTSLPRQYINGTHDRGLLIFLLPAHFPSSPFSLLWIHHLPAHFSRNPCPCLALIFRSSNQISTWKSQKLNTYFVRKFLEKYNSKLEIYEKSQKNNSPYLKPISLLPAHFLLSMWTPISFSTSV